MYVIRFNKYLYNAIFFIPMQILSIEISLYLVIIDFR